MSPAERRTRRERRQAARNRPRAERSVWRGPLPIGGSLVAVAAVVAFFILARSPGQQPPVPTSSATAAAVVAAVTNVSPAVLDAVAGGGLANSLRATDAPVLRGASGKPAIVYVGAEYCPFCASQRWSLVVALSRFGRFEGLGLTRSSSTDVFPNTATLTFRGSTYTSDLLEFSPVETQDREGKPLETISPFQAATYTRFDPSGGIPYLSLGDRAYVVGSGYPPDVLAGKSWQDIGSRLASANDPAARAILGNADFIAAAICDLTDGRPAAVCGSASVKGLPPPR